MKFLLLLIATNLILCSCSEPNTKKSTENRIEQQTADKNKPSEKTSSKTTEKTSSKTSDQTPNETAKVYIVRGVNKDNMGDFKGAEIEFTKAIQVDPNNLAAFSLRGSLRFLRLNNLTGACLDITRAVELGGDKNTRLIYKEIKKYCE